ncbi:hypothetical protein NDU88_002111 [Pleurodeles waltl]|uniref:Uncharacterized protein n=1 Tax=Pleurodeles waltl TaxID=8319 RepID=A0AAV7PD52_PLEWA|nr:hypothetical protein NDU88_002111 [Pleurodeles waltl]
MRLLCLSSPPTVLTMHALNQFLFLPPPFFFIFLCMCALASSGGGELAPEDEGAATHKAPVGHGTDTEATSDTEGEGSFTTGTRGDTSDTDTSSDGSSLAVAATSGPLASTGTAATQRTSSALPAAPQLSIRARSPKKAGISFAPGTSGPAPVTPAALSEEVIDLLQTIIVGQSTLLNAIQGVEREAHRSNAYLEGIHSGQAAHQRSFNALASALTAAIVPGRQGPESHIEGGQGQQGGEVSQQERGPGGPHKPHPGCEGGHPRAQDTVTEGSSNCTVGGRLSRESWPGLTPLTYRTSTAEEGPAVQKGTAEQGPAVQKGTAEQGPAVQKGTAEQGPTVQKGTAEQGPAKTGTAPLGPSSQAPLRWAPPSQAPLRWALPVKHRSAGPFISSTAPLGPAVSSTAPLGPAVSSTALLGPAVSSTALLGPSCQAPLRRALHLKHRSTGPRLLKHRSAGPRRAPPSQAPLRWAPPSQAPLRWALPVKHRSAGPFISSTAPLGPSCQAPLRWALPVKRRSAGPRRLKHRWPNDSAGSVSSYCSRCTRATLPPPLPVETVIHLIDCGFALPRIEQWASHPL